MILFNYSLQDNQLKALNPNTNLVHLEVNMRSEQFAARLSQSEDRLEVTDGRNGLTIPIDSLPVLGQATLNDLQNFLSAANDANF